MREIPVGLEFMILGLIRRFGIVGRTRRLAYADSRMKDLLLTLLHLAVVIAKLSGPGGVRAVIFENLWRPFGYVRG